MQCFVTYSFLSNTYNTDCFAQKYKHAFYITRIIQIVLHKKYKHAFYITRIIQIFFHKNYKHAFYITRIIQIILHKNINMHFT